MASTRPKLIACPFVNVFIADKAMLNPAPARSTANTSTDRPWNVNLQHVPQLGEFHPPTAAAPPMFGKRGRDPNVLKPLVSNPLGPSEQDTVARLCPPLSYIVSNETVTPNAEVAKSAREEMTAKTFIFVYGEDSVSRADYWFVAVRQMGDRLLRRISSTMLTFIYEYKR